MFDPSLVLLKGDAITMRRTPLSILVSFIVGLSMLLSSSVLVLSTAGHVRAQQTWTPDAVQTDQQPSDRGWPRGFSLSDEAQAVLYQPQVLSWENQKHMVALAAVSYVAKDEKKPVFGTVKIEADTLVSLEPRLVKFSQLKLTEANFQTLPKEQAAEIVSTIEKSIPDEDRLIALDRVLVQVDKSQISPKNLAGIKADPPKIFLSRTPAILLSFDGEPIWSSTLR